MGTGVVIEEGTDVIGGVREGGELGVAQGWAQAWS